MMFSSSLCGHIALGTLTLLETWRKKSDFEQDQHIVKSTQIPKYSSDGVHADDEPPIAAAA